MRFHESTLNCVEKPIHAIFVAWLEQNTYGCIVGINNQKAIFMKCLKISATKILAQPIMQNLFWSKKRFMHVLNSKISSRNKSSRNN